MIEVDGSLMEGGGQVLRAVGRGGPDLKSRLPYRYDAGVPDPGRRCAVLTCVLQRHSVRRRRKARHLGRRKRLVVNAVADTHPVGEGGATARPEEQEGKRDRTDGTDRTDRRVHGVRGRSRGRSVVPRC